MLTRADKLETGCGKLNKAGVKVWDVVFSVEQVQNEINSMTESRKKKLYINWICCLADIHAHTYTVSYGILS